MSSYKTLQLRNELLEKTISELTRRLMIVSIETETSESRYIRSYYRLKHKYENGLWYGDIGEYKSCVLSKKIK